MVVKFQGAFLFHDHRDTDDLFLVLEGELFVARKGMRHRPRAEREAKVLLIEPSGTPNTGDAATASAKARI